MNEEHIKLTRNGENIMDAKYDLIKENIFNEVSETCSKLNWDPTDTRLLWTWSSLQNIMNGTGLLEEYKELVETNHKETLNYLRQEISTLPCEVTLVSDYDDFKKWTFEGGYILYEIIETEVSDILGAKTGARILWSAANDFEGGGNFFDSIADNLCSELARHFIDEAIDIIKRIQTGEYILTEPCRVCK